MTEKQKIQIKNLRDEGYGYIKISQTLGISVNTVKSFCRRKNLTGITVREVSITPLADGNHFCRNCGKEVEQSPGRKQKKFCSDKCRMQWWNSHLDRVNRKANYDFVCPHCKKAFVAYGNSGRKYCSHACYIADRFGG